MFEGLKNFITKLQNSSEPVRRRYLVLLSGASMALVIFLWVAYLNVVVKPVAPEFSAAPVVEKPGLAQVFGTGLEVVLGQTKDAASRIINFLKEKFGKSNTIILDKSERNFILEESEEIPKTPLP